MAEVVKNLGFGGQTIAPTRTGVESAYNCLGMQELEHGMSIADSFKLRGRKPTEERLPNLVEDIRSIVEPQSQTDPSFKSSRLYTRLSAAEVRRQLITVKGDEDEDLPCAETIRKRLNQMGSG